MCGGAMILAVGAGCTRLASNSTPKAVKLSVIIQVGSFKWSHVVNSFVIKASLILLAMTITASSVKSLQAKQGLPIINQTSAWVILGTFANQLTSVIHLIPMILSCIVDVSVHL
jgi:phosphatidylinositol glycan class N